MKKMECSLKINLPQKMRDDIEAAAVKTGLSAAAWVRFKISSALEDSIVRPVGRPKVYRWLGKECTEEEYNYQVERVRQREEEHAKIYAGVRVNPKDLKEMKFNNDGNPIDDDGKEIPYEP